MAEEKKSTYTPARAKAIKKYLGTKAEIKMRLDPNKKKEIETAAARDGLSVNAWILEAIESKLNN